MDTHRMVDRLQICEEQPLTYLALMEVKEQLQQLDSQMVEMQRGRERQF